MISVVGSLHLDVVVRADRMPALDETLMGDGVAYVFGGKGGNQAVSAAKHGAATAMIGAVGRDRFADQILAALDAAGVDRTAVVNMAGASGMSVAIIDRNGDYGAVVVSAANRHIDPETLRLPSGTRILLLQNEVSDAVNLAAARQARALGAKIILNAAPARPLPGELAALLDLLVVNRGEAAAISGLESGTPYDAASILGARIGCDVVVTLGGDGLLMLPVGGELSLQPAEKVQVVSTHGAGDSFVGALAVRLSTGDGVWEACAFAQNAAARHVSAGAP